MIIRYLLIFQFLIFIPNVYSTSYIGTDLSFTHFFENNVRGSTADAMPNFNIFYLSPINDNLLYIADVHYQWNVFSDGYLGALKFKHNLGLKQESPRLLTTEFIGIAPSWLTIKREYTESYGDYYSNLTITHEMFKTAIAFDFLIGIRQMFGKNRFFSFGWTAEYSFLIPFFDISEIFIDELVGLKCVKAGFSFTFRTSKNDDH